MEITGQPKCEEYEIPIEPKWLSELVDQRVKVGLNLIYKLGEVEESYSVDVILDGIDRFADYNPKLNTFKV